LIWNPESLIRAFFLKKNFIQSLTQISQIKKPLKTMDASLRWHDSGQCPLWNLQSTLIEKTLAFFIRLVVEPSNS